jgi:hypothetical protein
LILKGLQGRLDFFAHASQPLEGEGDSAALMLKGLRGESGLTPSAPRIYPICAPRTIFVHAGTIFAQFFEPK